ncbi:MAG: hypothetical protein B6I19_03070 [Bacteroidetes bacterium 4572_114]|nr:MAG: hypothetical protein B6I19_03070 [Bacteroidetes bacterium 4572_114]
MPTLPVRQAIPEARGDGGPGTVNQGFHPFSLVRDLNPCNNRFQVVLGFLNPSSGIRHPSFTGFKFPSFASLRRAGRFQVVDSGCAWLTSPDTRHFPGLQKKSIDHLHIFSYICGRIKKTTKLKLFDQ